MTRPSELTPPPGAAERCQDCGGRLIACYPGQQLHPMCDPTPPGMTGEQIAYWSRQVALRTGAITRRGARGRRS